MDQTNPINYLLVTAIVGVIALLPTLLEYLRRPSDKTRYNSDGLHFAELSDGATHYRWFGPKNGPIVICLHGIATPSAGFEPLASELAERGYRVLTYDYYGRGLSSYVPGAQDAAFFDRQFRDLLAHEGVVEDFSLIASSAGAPIAIQLAGMHLTRLRQLILVSPFGFHEPKRIIAALRARYPLFGRLMLRYYYPIEAKKHIERSLHNAAIPMAIQDARAAQMKRRGYFPSNLSAKTNVLNNDISDDLRKIAASRRPVLAIWAEHDQLVPDAAHRALSDKLPSACQVTISDADHSALFTHPTEIAAEIAKVSCVKPHG